MSRLTDFQRDRNLRWRRLEELIDLHDGGLLQGEGVDELYRLYRLSASDLSYLQSRTGNPALLDRLENLVARAHARIAPPPETGRLGGLCRFVAYGFPAAMRRERKAVLLALFVFFAGGAFGALLPRIHPESAATLLSAFPHLLEQTPAEDAAERSSEEYDQQPDAHFSLYLFAHNAMVAVTCFALGLTFGVGTLIILFYNGMILGCTAAGYAADGVFGFFLAWVGPHGALELPAIIVASSAGLILARAELAGWGPHASFARRDCLALVVGAAFLLLLAGLIEGGFSQRHGPRLQTVKIVFACVMFAGLLAWTLFLPLKNREEAQP